MRKIFLPLCLLFSSSLLHAQMTVTANQTAQELAQMLVGQGVVMLNPTMNGTCPGTASGKFTFGTNPSDIGIDSGIVLTCGNAVDFGGNPGVANPASSFASHSFPGGNPYAPGDAQLDALLASFGSSSTTNDACVLEFDFVPAGDTIKFDYVFGSDEYPTFACSSFNDVFGFFITGPGITGSPDIALVPGTNIPVAINSINNDPNPSSECTNMGPGSPFSMYYIDNEANNGQYVVYNGFTTVLTAVAGVYPCDTYHLKLAIADAGDAGYDSGVFLKSGSLNSVGIALTPESTEGSNTSTPHCVRGCKSAEIIFSRPVARPAPLTVKYLIEGDAGNGIDYASIADSIVIPAGQAEASLEIKPLLAASATGPKTVTIKALSPYDCGNGQNNIIDSTSVVIFDSLFVNIPTPPVTVCPNTEITITAEIDPTLDYQWEPAALIPDPLPLGLTIHPKPTVPTTYTITATMPGAPATCPPARSSYFANVEPIPQIILPATDTTICIQDSISLNVFALPEDIGYTFQWDPPTYLRDDFSGNNKFFAPVGDYEYTITATSPIAHCSNSASMTIHVIPPFTFESVNPSDTTIEYGDEIQLSSEGEAVFWLWDPVTYLSDPTIRQPYTRPTESIVYTLVGTNQYGCTDTALVRVNVAYNSNSGMPNAFTPNGDGLNDVFKIENLEYEKLLYFKVFNRWGQLVYDGKNPEKGWDGTINGKPAPTGVYFYQVDMMLPNGKEKSLKGDLTLIR